MQLVEIFHLLSRYIEEGGFHPSTQWSMSKRTFPENVKAEKGLLDFQYSFQKRKKEDYLIRSFIAPIYNTVKAGGTDQTSGQFWSVLTSWRLKTKEAGMGFTDTSPICSQLDPRETAKLQTEEQICKDAFNRLEAVIRWRRITRKNNNHSPS